MATTDTTTCWVYRSPRKPEMYVYLAAEDDFDRLPDALRPMLGTLELVLKLELHPQRRLARVEATDVLAALDEQGFYIQLPPGRPEHTDD